MPLAIVHIGVPCQVRDVKWQLEGSRLSLELLIELFTGFNAVRLQGQERLEGLHGEEPPDVAPPSFRELTGLAVVLQSEAMMVLILELFHDVH